MKNKILTKAVTGGIKTSPNKTFSDPENTRSGLKIKPPQGLEKLNELAKLSSTNENGTEDHTKSLEEALAENENTQLTDDYPETYAISLWKKVKVNLDHLFIKKEHRSTRTACYGQVVFLNAEGKKVTTGSVTDLNEKSGGFVVEMVYIGVGDLLYLQFLDADYMELTQVKVKVMRLQEWGARMKIGVEFAGPSAVFKRKLKKFLSKWRSEKSGFSELESRW